jgi:hypothetical protein
MGLEACNEIPQNRQSFLWKSLQKTSGDLEKLGEKDLEARLYSAVFAPSRDAAASVSRPGGAPRQGGKFSYPQSLEKSRNGKILPGPPAAAS